MSQAREIGYAIRQAISKDSAKETALMSALSINSRDVNRLYAGRIMLTSAEIKKAASAIGVPFTDFAFPDQHSYDSKVVHCMTGFKDRNNREQILDIINAYIDARESLITD